MTKQSRISVIMAAYNADEFIGDAIGSVLRQTHQNWELLVADDGSQDDTAGIVAAHSDSRIKLLRLRHRGVSAARNAALDRMCGDAFVFLDADDALTETSLSSRLSVLEARPEVEFVDGRVVFTDERLETEKTCFQPAFHGRPLARLVELSSDCFAGASWMVRRRQGKVYRLKEGMTHCEDLLFYVTISSDELGEYDYTDQVVAKVRRGHVTAMSNLEGLERGYQMFSSEVERCVHVDAAALRRLRRRIRRIVWRSYAKNGRWFSALRSLVLPLQTTGTRPQ